MTQSEFTQFWFPVLLTAVVSSTGLALGHYAPWRLLLRRDLRPVEAYVWGILWLYTPLTITVLLTQWSGFQVLGAFWLVTLFGGLAVFGVYALDAKLDALHREREQAELEALRREAKA